FVFGTGLRYLDRLFAPAILRGHGRAKEAQRQRCRRDRADRHHSSPGPIAVPRGWSQSVRPSVSKGAISGMSASRPRVSATSSRAPRLPKDRSKGLVETMIVRGALRRLPLLAGTSEK